MTEKQIIAKVHRVLIRRANKRADARIALKNKGNLCIRSDAKKAHYYVSRVPAF